VQLLWALARVRAPPTAAAQQAFFTSTGAALASATARAPAALLTDAAWAVGSLGMQPPAPWAGAWRRRMADAAGELVPEELAVVLGCCRGLELAGPEALGWLELLLGRACSSEALSGCEPHVLGDVLQALAALRFAPSQPLWRRLEDAVALASLTCDAGMLVALRAALGDVGGAGVASAAAGGGGGSSGQLLDALQGAAG
jgi:hypothetical protein